MEEFDTNWAFDDDGVDKNHEFYKFLKEKYKKSYEKAVKSNVNCQFGRSIWQKAAKMAQSALFWCPIMTFLTKLLFLSCLLFIVMYILLLFSNVVFGI